MVYGGVVYLPLPSRYTPHPSPPCSGLCCSVAKPCLTLRDPVNYSPPGSSSIGFPRQEYYSGLPFPSPGDLPDPGIEPLSPALAVRFFTTDLTGKPRKRQTKDSFRLRVGATPQLTRAGCILSALELTHRLHTVKLVLKVCAVSYL